MPRTVKRRTIKTLPADAVSVRNYADSLGVTTPAVYYWAGKENATIEIVVYNGFNFVTFKNQKNEKKF